MRDVILIYAKKKPPSLSLPLLVCWGVSNQGRQAADGMTMRNWHGVVGTRKQTAAIFIFACFLLPHKKSGTATWQLLEAQPKERKGEEEEEISLVLILPPPPPIMGGKSGAQIPSEQQRNELLTKTRTQISCSCVIICCVGGKKSQ